MVERLDWSSHLACLDQQAIDVEGPNTLMYQYSVEATKCPGSFFLAQVRGTCTTPWFVGDRDFRNQPPLLAQSLPRPRPPIVWFSFLCPAACRDPLPIDPGTIFRSSISHRLVFSTASKHGVLSLKCGEAELAPLNKGILSNSTRMPSTDKATIRAYTDPHTFPLSIASHIVGRHLNLDSPTLDSQCRPTLQARIPMAP